MILSEVQNLQSGPKLDALVAEKLFGSRADRNFRCPKCEGSHFGTAFKGPNYREIEFRHCHDEFSLGCRWKGQDDQCMRHDEYSTDMNAAYKVEQEVCAKHRHEYVMTLIESILGRRHDHDTDELYALIHATPEQRCKAALAVLCD